MGVSTSLLMVYQWNNINDWSSYDILNSIEEALKIKYKDVGRKDNSDFHISFCTMNFADGQDKRALHIFRNVDVDHYLEFLTHKDNKFVVFSFGAWGNNIEIMEYIADYLKEKLQNISDAKKFPISNIRFMLDKSDSDNIGYEEIKLKTQNILKFKKP